MRNKYEGVIPAFYACYDENGEICSQRTASLANHLVRKGVQGLYVGGSSGECIYHSVAERKLTLEAVMEAVGDKVTVIAHVACNNTRDSVELARHAQSCGVDAIAAIPPIYFHLPEHSIADYWNAISAGAPDTDFFIYNIPQLAGVCLTPALLARMIENPRVVGVKNSSMPVCDIQAWRSAGVLVLNGPDEQFVPGLAAGACGGIGGTYAVMPELFLKAYGLMGEGRVAQAASLQQDICRIIEAMCAAKANLYAVMKGVLSLQGLEIGSVRPPLSGATEEDDGQIRKSAALIEQAIRAYC